LKRKSFWCRQKIKKVFTRWIRIVALYSFEAREEAVLILAIRHQREAGFWQRDDA